ncbi:anthranilate synthase component I family protein [uncultured Desulfovibrio sp.]|uniref:anthranilate synthase component I family protein n=1 Tax=uncultured Desulfovibrio sp. TaxID=167968 RepID=UPI00260EFF37|nr:anthranilate synthase component I family protein [uncultured Desulfovibrio sp.]
MDTPISLFLGMAGNGDGILLESAEVDGRWGRYSVLACDMALVLTCREGRLAVDIRDDRLAPLAAHDGQPYVTGLRALMRQLRITPPEGMDVPPITRALYGWLGFGMARLFHPTLAGAMPEDEAEAALVLPGTVLLFDHLYNRLCQISLGEHREVSSGRQTAEAPLPDAGEVTASPDEAGYKAVVERIRAMLHAGEAIQVVPSVRFSTPFAGDAFTLYRRMRRYNASPYMFYMKIGDMTLFGSSPEVMVRCTRGRLQLSPIAGTRRRGRDDAEDARLAQELRDDPKERAEHVMLVDLGRNDLGRVARPGSVSLERCMEVERFSHVMHLTSRVTAQLDEGKDALDVLAATFPAGTVSGAPKVRAMQIIREMEGRGRGPYAGCVGWLGLDKDAVHLDTGITIRSMWLRDGELCWQAGGGIVHDSDPELEWKEVCNKSAIMRLALRNEEECHVSAHR